MTRAAMIERRLVDQLRRDRSHPSRRTTGPDGTITVISGTSCGLVMALEHETGEPFDHILKRIGKET